MKNRWLDCREKCGDDLSCLIFLEDRSILILSNNYIKWGEDSMRDINFKYVFDDNYNPQYVNGAFGGVGP